MNEHLHNLTDEELTRLITEAKQILHERDKAYKRETMAKIRAMAAEAGLTVNLKSRRKAKPRPQKSQEVQHETDH